MSAIMLCTCSGDQSRFEDIPRSPESLATRDFSANGSSSKIASRETTPDDSQVNEVESDLRETLSLNYEVDWKHQRGNFDAALLVLQGIDIRSLRPRMTSAIAESIKSRVPPRSSRRKTSQVNGMLMHMSMHSVSLLLEAILLKAKSLEGLGRLMDIFHSALEYLPKLWMRSCCFEEAIIAYRRALAKPWNLDSERSANLQKDLAVTLLYCGVEVKFPEEFGQKGNLLTPGNNIEEAIFLLLVLTRKLSLQEIKWDPDLVNHLMYALSLSGHHEVLASHLEMLLPGTYTRSERWSILALCNSAAGMDDSALNIIRNGFCVLERKGKPHIPSLLLGAKLCSKKEVWKSTTCSEVKSLQKLEMDAWLDLASIYTKLEAWHDSNICLDKARSIDFFYPKYWHVREVAASVSFLLLKFVRCTFAGLQLEGQSLHQEALMAFSFALSINPDYVPSMVSMAGILRNLGGNSLSNYCLR
ncbi:hypothetical protein SETIT_J005800v2 [Setaria italica]|uniref:Uncharacterized protein n=2 Tax=Setaria TaxID=4554 RepID=A0A368PEW0_SETIT|nr:hypothetical protein SETIT_J005800v2 [Setaria italica]TKW38946.1 hypothetical protein SEVIR_1G145653v2 [Setaria viridis]